jgi:hypothetical protein
MPLIIRFEKRSGFGILIEAAAATADVFKTGSKVEPPTSKRTQGERNLHTIVGSDHAIPPRGATFQGDNTPPN